MKKLKLLLILIIFSILKISICFADIVINNTTDKYICVDCIGSTFFYHLIIGPNTKPQTIEGNNLYVTFSIYDENPDVNSTAHPIKQFDEIKINTSKTLIITKNDEGEILIIKRGAFQITTTQKTNYKKYLNLINKQQST